MISFLFHSKSYLEKWDPDTQHEIFNTFLEIQLQLCLLILLYINPMIKKVLGLVKCDLLYTNPSRLTGFLWYVTTYIQRIPKYNF